MATTRGKAAKADKVTVQGIEVELKLDPTDDYEITELLITHMDENSTNRERSEATVKSYRLILGDQYQRVKDELRAKHDGRLTNEDMISFMNDLMAASAALKN